MAEDYEKTYADFWQDIVEHPDGTLNRDRIMRELYDFHVLLEEVPKVYCEVTGGRVSRPDTAAHQVIGEVEERTQEAIRETCAEIAEEIRAEAAGEDGSRCPCHEDAARIALRVAGIEDDPAAESAKEDTDADL